MEVLPGAAAMPPPQWLSRLETHMASMDSNFAQVHSKLQALQERLVSVEDKVAKTLPTTAGVQSADSHFRPSTADLRLGKSIREFKSTGEAQAAAVVSTASAGAATATAASNGKPPCAMSAKVASMTLQDEVFGDLGAKDIGKRGFAPQDISVSRRCLLMPTSRLRFCWDLTTLLLILFVSISLPFRTAFVQTWSLAWDLCDFFIDVFFIADIFVNLRTIVYRCMIPPGSLALPTSRTHTLSPHARLTAALRACSRRARRVSSRATPSHGLCPMS